ncbi:MAG: hypothetical protein M0R22_00450 [Dehalococcoidia bacterium]|jgi:hypothetical protein|nr:hypothetical protein [Dehalococcoidia bacterium]
MRRKRTGPSPTKIVCEKQPDGSSRCCTYKRGVEEPGMELRCFTSQSKKRSKRGGTLPPEE